MKEFNKNRIDYFPDDQSCSAYITYSGESMIEPLQLKSDMSLERKAGRYEIVFILSGCIRLTRRGYDEQTVHARRFFLLPPGEIVTYHATEDARIIICRLKYSIGKCKSVSLDSVRPYAADCEGKIHALPCKKPMREFIKSLSLSLEYGLRCEMYLVAKYTELMFLLRTYYSKQELACFFEPIYGHDVGFRTFIFNNIDSAKTVSELARRYHLSEVGFRKKFKKEMGVSPMDFLMDRKKEQVYHEIVHGAKSFKLICQEYGINSQSNLNTFCQRAFGRSPISLRNPESTISG